MTDIIGFTKLTRQKEAIVSEIDRTHKSILHSNVSEYQGMIIYIFGDRSVSVFSDPVDAVKCSIRIHQAFEQEPGIPLRIAIHYGEISVVGDDIIGEAIKLTSRILKKAIASCILISEAVNSFLEGETGFQTQSIGICQLKHVDNPVEIFGICHESLVLPDPAKMKQRNGLRAQTMSKKGTRLLAAIMFTDMVGYTALMQKDEKKAKDNRDRHRKILQETIAEHHGKILQYYGDGTLSIFNSSIEAIACAIQIQKKLQLEPKIPLRIGLHTGDIVYDHEGIYGDGVNVASRIEGLAVAGSILISGKVFDDIKNHNSISTVSLGVFDLKNVKKPIEVYAISNQGLSIPAKAADKDPPKEKEKSLAILPFANFSSDAENEFFSDGISEAIINALTQLEGLYVTARTSSFSFKGQNKDIREVGKILGVVYILEGSVQRHKNKIRVTAQLIDTLNGFHIFSEVYDRELIDVFSIQDEIALLIADTLKKKINLDEKRLITTPKTENIQAFDFYMKGVQLMNTGSHPNIVEAMELFRQSIASDPDFVLPYTGICICYTFLGAWGFIDEGESYSKSSEYALKALEKDPNDPKALAVHAMSSFWSSNWDVQVFESALKKALKIAPGSSEIRLFHGIYKLIHGDLEGALIEIRLALKLDPLNPNIFTRLGYTYLCLKDYENARTTFRKAHEIAHLDEYYQFILSWSYLLQEQYDQAESALNKVDEEKDGYKLKQGVEGFLHARQGRIDQAHAKLKEIKQLDEEGKMKFPCFNQALVYAGLNKVEEMYSCLERARSEKPISLMFIRADPFWEGYRQDEAYKELLSKLFK